MNLHLHKLTRSLVLGPSLCNLVQCGAYPLVSQIQCLNPSLQLINKGCKWLLLCPLLVYVLIHSHIQSNWGFFTSFLQVHMWTPHSEFGLFGNPTSMPCFSNIQYGFLSLFHKLNLTIQLTAGDVWICKFLGIAYLLVRVI